MRVEVTIKSNRVVDAIMGEIGPESRRQLNSVAGRAVMNAVQRHIRSYMREKHRSARMLGATPTGHYEKGAAAISMSADATGATVTIPIPGIARAWGDVSIRPGPGKSALTLPQAAISYGRTVAEIRALGWKVFRPKGKSVLMGEPPAGGEATILYSLVGGVVQRRDPSLMPSLDEIADIGFKAIWKRIESAVSKARQGGLK